MLRRLSLLRARSGGERVRLPGRYRSPGGAGRDDQGVRRRRHAHHHPARRGEPGGRPARGDAANVLQDAVVAIEDDRFWAHKGVDLRAVARAAREQRRARARSSRAGSTITQQYVKNVLLDAEQDVRPQAPGGVARRPARAEVLEGADPRALPEHHLLRERRLRRAGRGPRVLRRAGRRTLDPRPGGPAGRPDPGARRPTTPTTTPSWPPARRQAVLDRMVELELVTTAEADSGRQAEPLGLRDQAGRASATPPPTSSSGSSASSSTTRASVPPRATGAGLLFEGRAADPHHRRPAHPAGRPRRRWPRCCQTPPTDPDGGRRRPRAGAPATCGPSSADGTSSAAEPRPSSTSPPRGSRRPGRRSSRSSWPRRWPGDLPQTRSTTAPADASPSRCPTVRSPGRCDNYEGERRARRRTWSRPPSTPSTRSTPS